MEKALLYWCAALSVINFLLMGWDKRFFFLALLGGALGAILGMYTFHHKTRHWYFKLGLPAILLLHLALVWFFWEYRVELLWTRGL